MKRLSLRVILGLAAFALHGCAAPVMMAPLMGSALSGGASAVGKAGTEHLSNGTIVRTLVEPMDRVHQAVTDTLRAVEITVQEDAVAADGGKIVADARHAAVQVKLEPLTPTLTRLSLRVKRGHFTRDRATASELVEQIDKLLTERAVASKSDRPPAVNARSSARTR